MYSKNKRKLVHTYSMWSLTVKNVSKFSEWRYKNVIWSVVVREITQNLLCKIQQILRKSGVFVYWNKNVCVITRIIPLHITFSFTELTPAIRIHTSPGASQLRRIVLLLTKVSPTLLPREIIKEVWSENMAPTASNCTLIRKES